MRMNNHHHRRRLAPLSEEPTNEDSNKSKKGLHNSWQNWLKNQLPLLFFNKKSHLKILLSVLACPLFPLSFLHSSKPPLNPVISSAQYIIQHFKAASGSKKIEGKVKNMYAIGKVKMIMKAEDHHHGHVGSSSVSVAGRMMRMALVEEEEERGCFVMWQMLPDKWLIELVASGHKVVAGCDGNMAWRHTPWLGAHAAKGPIRPLRRALQGLDPVTVAAVFSTAELIGEKHIWNEDCFVLKLSVDQGALSEQSQSEDNTADIIKHVILGYFSQRSGLLVHLEDSQLTRIQSPGTYPTYWETTIASKMDDYRDVDGVMIAHSGQSFVTLTRFANDLTNIPVCRQMEETWTVDDVVFNVPGLSIECFIPPEQVQNKTN